MHVLQALLLWLFVSGLIIGGAVAFRRFFPEESPWWGFIVPPFGFVLLFDFIEHFVALPNLLILFPVLVGLLGWLIFSARFSRRELLLPSLIFLAAFALTYGVRCVQPDILPTSDGLSDLNKINDYSQGDTLPPIDTWLPPFHYTWYYSLQHYAASIVKRLFHLPLGVAYNVTHALLTALTCVAGAAAAHRLSGGRTWIPWAVLLLIVSAATGSSAYILLTTHDPSSWYANNLSGGAISPPNDNILWRILALDPYRERLELQVPGFWIWRDEFHANSSGHFLTLLAVLVVAELFFPRRTIWPWLMAVFIPLLAVAASTWAFPITLLVCGGAAALALWCGLRPAPVALAGTILCAGLILLWPAFYDVTSSPEAPAMMWTKTEWRVPLFEFLVQWWPIILLWSCGWFYFRDISPGLRWIFFVIPIMLIGVELITVEGRYNTVEKMWGYTFGTALVALFPIVAARAQLEDVGFALCRLGAAYAAFFPALVRWARLPEVRSALRRSLADTLMLFFRWRGLGFRLVTAALLLSACISLGGWVRATFHWVAWDEFCHLEGNRYLTNDAQKNRILHVMTQVKNQTFLSGKSVWCYNESPSPAVFTGNRSYLAWFYFESVADYEDEALYRNKLNNDFYSGAMADPLKFLVANDIAGVLIWPDDNITNDFLATLTKQLDPAYQYVDCRGDGAQNAGVFLRRPLTEK